MIREAHFIQEREREKKLLSHTLSHENDDVFMLHVYIYPVCVSRV